MIYLYVTPSGSVNLIEGEKMPKEPELCLLAAQDQCEDRSEFRGLRHVCKCRAKEIDYTAALESAKASSVPVDDQERAKKLCFDALYETDGDRMANRHIRTSEGTIYGPFDIGYGLKTIGHGEQVAILLPEKEPDHEDYTKRLKPCPMCGGKPGESVFFIGYLRPGDYGVKCIACSMSLHQDRVDKVIGVWNTRDAKTGLLDPIAALKESEPVGKLEEKEEQAAAMYLGKQFVDYGDLNEKAEQQIINAFKAGVKWAQGRGSL